MKENWKPGTMIYPLPAVLISLGGCEEEYNLITVAWVGTVCTNPPMCYISVRPERHSHTLLLKYKAFAINLTTASMARVTDWCGVRSGRQYNKFKETGLTPQKAAFIQAPIVAESPLCIECKVKEVMHLGSHDMFLAEVVNVQADTQYLDPESGKFDLEKANLLVYAHGNYYQMGEWIGKFGWSVKKKKKKTPR